MTPVMNVQVFEAGFLGNDLSPLVQMAEVGAAYAIGEYPGVATPARQHSENRRRRL